AGATCGGTGVGMTSVRDTSGTTTGVGVGVAAMSDCSDGVVLTAAGGTLGGTTAVVASDVGASAVVRTGAVAAGGGGRGSALRTASTTWGRSVAGVHWRAPARPTAASRATRPAEMPRARRSRVTGPTDSPTADRTYQSLSARSALSGSVSGGAMKGRGLEL